MPAPVAVAAPREPAFWFGFEVSWAKLAFARVAIFALLAVDALVQIRHAPRYGAGGFNVAQLPLLDALGPTRDSYAIAELVNAYLFVLAACGVMTRIVIPIAATIYAWLYFGSQLDSYQHHYLVAIVLLLACFIPWQRPAGARPDTPVRSWALRVLLVQLAIMYLWAAVSKMNAAWLDGTTLAGQIGGIARTIVDGTVHTRGAAWLVLASELVLAATVWSKPGWRIAAPLGIAFHYGILASTLEIGLFAWLMLAIYILVVPDRVWIAIAHWPPLSALHRRLAPLAEVFAGLARWLAWAAALAAGVVLAAIARFDHALVVGLALAGVPLAAAFLPKLRAQLPMIALAHVLAFATWTAVDRASTVVFDYYKLWGGTERRLGDRDSAERAYRGMISVAPDSANAHYHLGRLLLMRGADEEGLSELYTSQVLAPHVARAFTAEARWLAQHGRHAEAVAKARAAVAADGKDRDARALLDSLGGSAPSAPAGGTREDDGDPP